jgi:TonB family protein
LLNHTTQTAIVTLILFMIGCATPAANNKYQNEPRLDPASPHKVMPASAMPLELRRFGKTGQVTFKLLIKEDGSVGDAKVLESSGYARFDEAVLEWYIHRARYLPAVLDGKPVAAWKIFFCAFKS